MKTQVIGATTAVKAPPGIFSMDWTTVWGIYVPPSIMPMVLWELELLGFEAKDLGHTIQVKWSADDPDRIDRAREQIKKSVYDWCLTRDAEEDNG